MTTVIPNPPTTESLLEALGEQPSAPDKWRVYFDADHLNAHNYVLAFLACVPEGHRLITGVRAKGNTSGTYDAYILYLSEEAITLLYRSMSHHGFPPPYPHRREKEGSPLPKRDQEAIDAEKNSG